MSHCNSGDIKFFEKYIKKFEQPVRKIFVMTCLKDPNYIEFHAYPPSKVSITKMEKYYPDYDIATWLLQHRNRLKASAEKEKNKHFILFLNSRSLNSVYKYREVEEVLKLIFAFILQWFVVFPK